MIPYGKHHIDDTDIQAVVDVLRGGTLTQGRYIDLFEKIVADYVGARFAVAVSSGTAALHLAMLAADVGPGDEVLTSPITFVASANAAIYVGAKAIFADIDSQTINISPLSIKQQLEKHRRIKAIVPVHFAGLPCDMLAIKNLADNSGATVIEDAAHALGASYLDGGRVGCCKHSLMTMFSFHPVKTIAAGEGGMITTNDESIYRKLLRLRSHGVNKLDDTFLLPDQASDGQGDNPWYYEMQELGFHYRITDIQSGLAASQMKRLDAFLSHRKSLAKRYDFEFSDSLLISSAQLVDKSNSGNHIYPVRINFKELGKTRREVMIELRNKNIGSQVHYIPVPMHPFYQQMGFKPEDYPEAMLYYTEALTLPLFFELSFEQQEFIITTLKGILNK